MRKIKQIVLTLLAFSTTLLLSVGFTGCELPDFNKLLGRGSSQVGTSLKTVNVKNGAKLNIIKGSTSNGYVAYYATAVNYIA